MIIDAIKVEQPIGNFYICTLKSGDLFELAMVDRVRISNDSDSLYDGIQRTLSKLKVKKIANYLKSPDATFPNSIILNLATEFFLGFENNQLEIMKNENAFTILDGQHRIEGLKEQGIDDFDVVLSIFVGLNKSDQSRIFVTINTEQTKIDPSHGMYQELYETLYTPRKMIVRVAEMFAVDKKSPWYNMLKLVGKKDNLSEDGILSLKAFATPLIEMIYDDNQYHELRNNLSSNNSDYSSIKRKVLWDLYIEHNESLLYKILFNYFSAIQEILYAEWGNKKGLLNKTTGYNGMMLLFEDIYEIGLIKGDLSNEFFKSILKPLNEFNSRINSTEFSPSGDKAAKELYTSFCEVLKLP